MNPLCLLLFLFLNRLCILLFLNRLCLWLFLQSGNRSFLNSFLVLEFNTDQIEDKNISANTSSNSDSETEYQSCVSDIESPLHSEYMCLSSLLEKHVIYSMTTQSPAESPTVVTNNDPWMFKTVLCNKLQESGTCCYGDHRWIRSQHWGASPSSGPPKLQEKAILPGLFVKLIFITGLFVKVAVLFCLYVWLFF